MKSNTFFTDFKSGIVVFLVALPLCLGISLACGVHLYAGIISGVIGGIVITLISDSRYSVSGPAAGLTAVVIAALASLGSLHAFLAAVVVAGVIQVALGALRAGGISNFIPNSVIKGMLAGIGIILIIKQLPHLVGYDADPEGDMYFDQPDGHNTISDLYYMVNNMAAGPIVIGIISFALLLFSETRTYKDNKYLSRAPGPLLVVVVGIVLTLVFSGSAYLAISPAHLVTLPSVDSVDDLDKIFTLPSFKLLFTAKFWTVAFTLAIVASLETLLNIEAIEKLDPERKQVNTNRELVAQGVGNIISGFIGGLPITSVIVRSSANIYAGAKTKLSVIIHAVLIMICVIAIPNVLQLIPNSTLAVILILTGYKLAKVSLFKEEYKMGWDQFLPFVVTIVVMLLTDLLKGVGAGVVVSVFYIIRFNVRSTIEVHEEYVGGKLVYLLRLPQHLTFFNKGFILQYLQKVERNSSLIIDGSINKSTDKDVKQVLTDFLATKHEKNIEVQIVKYSL